MNTTTKKVTLKDREIAATKAAEVKGGPIFMNFDLVQKPNNGLLIGLLVPAVQKTH